MSTLQPGEKIVNRTVINNDETLCTFSFVHNPDSTKQGMFAYPQEGDRSPIKIQNMVIKSNGYYKYYNNESVHYKSFPYDRDWILKNKYNEQKIKYTDGVLTQEEAMSKGGYKRKSKSQRRKKSKSQRRRKSKSQRRRKSIKRRH